MKKFLSAVLAMSMVLSLTACGGGAPSSSASGSGSAAGTSSTGTSSDAKKPDFTVAMVTDVGGVNDQSFNQSAWEGLSSLADKGVKAEFVESKDETEYTPNLDKIGDKNPDLIWGIGFMMADAVKDASTRNPDKQYAIVDFDYTDEKAGTKVPENIICANFKSEEASFLAGYVAGKMTKTNSVGFVGGVKGLIISQFENGYKAGVATAAKELGKEIKVEVQYANSFNDAAIGKGIAVKMYENCDVVFHAAGGTGIGVIEAAKEKDKWVIGVDRDQNSLAPDNVITSVMKRVGEAMSAVTLKVKAGEKLGGTSQVFGLADGAVGLAPTSSKNVPAEILEATKKLEEKIIKGEIVVPSTDEMFKNFKA